MLDEANVECLCSDGERVGARAARCGGRWEGAGTYRPVIALNDESQPAIDVLTGYDLNPSRMSSVTLIAAESASESP